MAGGDTYRLQILFDDSKVKKLLTMLERFNGTSGSSQSGSKGGFGSNPSLKNLAKLGGIAVGIAAIVTLVKKIASMVVDASPMLQGMLKLFNTAMLFILRPIGDFLGFFLRPIIVFFLRSIAIPMYRQWAPIMRTLGSWLGNNTLKIITDNAGTIKDTIFILLGPISSNLTKFAEIIERLIPITVLAIEKLTPIFIYFTENLLSNIDGFLKIMEILSSTFKGIGDIFVRVENIFKSIVGGFIQGVKGAFAGIATFFTGVWTSIVETLQPAWDVLSGFINSIIDFFKGIWEFITGGISSLFGGGGSTGGVNEARSSKGGDINVVIENINANDITSGQSLGVQAGEEIAKTIHKRVRGFT